MKKRWSYDRVVLALTVLFMLCAGMLLAVRLFLRGEWLVETENGYNDIVSDTTEEDARPDSLLPGEVMDLNRASVGDLTRLPGIGWGRAEDIVAYRQEHGSFRSVDELDAVKGIGAATLEKLLPYVTVGAPGENEH